MSRLHFVKVIAAMSMIYSLGLATSPTQISVTKMVGQVTGTVSDTNGARVANAAVTLEGEGTVRTLATSEDGSYEFVLPTGVYRLRVNSAGFCPTRRAPFVVTPSTAVRLDLTLAVCPIVNTVSIVDGRYKGETDKYQLPFKEETLQLDCSTATPLELLVQFGERSEVGDIIRYKSTRSHNTHLQVNVSYNFITLYADEVSFSKQSRLLKARGNVIYDDGKQRVEAKGAEIKFNAGESSIKLVQ